MQQQNNINQTIIPLYQYKQKIVISEGFYKGFFGLILSYEQKGNMIYYKVLIKDSDKDIMQQISEEHIKAKTKLFGIL